MPCASKIAKAVVIACLLWFLAFPLFGGSAWGKGLFASWGGKSFLHDKKAGVPILMLTFPVLVAGTVATLFVIRPGCHLVQRQRTPRDTNPSSLFGRRLPDQESLLLAGFVFFPCLVYVLASMVRKLSFDMSLDTALMKSGNIFGMLAVVVLSWLLVPVSYRGPIGRFFAWDAIGIVGVHAWGGRIVVAASLLHGAEHTLRYALQGRDVFVAFYLPPIGCWKNPRTYAPEICDREDGDDEGCSCYDHFLPLTGLAAVVGLVLIGVSSLQKVRRKNYATFATLHYALAPLTFLTICIHYNKAILYASGSLLYYLASNIPSWIDGILQRQPFLGAQANVKVLAVEKLESHNSNNNQPQRPCVALTIEASEATTRHFVPGTYVNMLVPAISRVSHPFTVNRVPGQSEQLRIVFRATGPFTRALERRLFFRSSTTTVPLISSSHEEDDAKDVRNHDASTDYRPSLAIPRLYLDGYYGSGRLASHVFGHDVSVVVAAGIGITPYLSLLSEPTPDLGNIVVSDGLMTTPNGDEFGASEQQQQQPRRIVLHWICRDRSLIEYCRREYFSGEKNLERETEQHSLKIIVHKTGGDDTPDADEPGATNAGANFLRTDSVDTSFYGGVPFEPSVGSVGGTIGGGLRFFVAFSVLSWGGLWCIWSSFQKQEKTEYVQRIYTLVALALFGLFAGALSNLLWNVLSKRSRKNAQFGAENYEEGKNSVENSNGVVELSTYKDEESVPRFGLVPTVPLEKKLIRPIAASFEISEGRPILDTILEDLDVGRSSALFCCVPATLAAHLREGLDRKSRLDGRFNAVPVYQESFEK